MPLYHQDFDAAPLGAIADLTPLGSAALAVVAIDPDSGAHAFGGADVHNDDMALLTFAPSSPNYDVLYRFTLHATDTSNTRNAAVMLRADAAGANGYLFSLDGYTGAIALYSKDSGTFNSLLSGSPLAAAPDGAKIWVRAQCKGTDPVAGANIRIRVWRDGTAEPSSWTGEIPTSSHTGSGRVILRASVAGATGPLAWDDLWVLDNDESPSSATGISVATAASGVAGVAQTVTVALVGGSAASPESVTLSDATGGTFSPPSVTLAALTSGASATSQYTPATAGAKTVTATGTGALGAQATASVTVTSGGGSGVSGSGTALAGPFAGESYGGPDITAAQYDSLYIAATLCDALGRPVDLTGTSTVNLEISDAYGRAPFVDAAVTVTQKVSADAADQGKVTYSGQAGVNGPCGTPGVFFSQLRAEWPDGTVLRFPNRDKIQVLVTRSLMTN
jgi:hypothetical protein